ncbi:BMC domain-containing protein [bacterium 1XD42-8]|jgi:ethanolamine utilization protein EutS|nr:BMC domain-containing protein [Lachnospiraceae bacterium]RKJ49009.1 BMC domain-containing protein [bacterium 1XD42-8]
MDKTFSLEDRMRIIQEIVPGRQITLAHVIANPDNVLFERLNLSKGNEKARGAIGIVTMSPGEMSIIGGDIALKASGVEIGFIDRFSGTLLITGNVSQVEEALKELVEYCKNTLEFTVCAITRT